MLLEALYHVPRDKWAYAYDPSTIHLRIRTKRDDVEQVYAMTGDKYDWAGTYQELPMEKAAHDRMFDYWEVAVRPKFKRLSYAFKLTAGTESVYLLDAGIQSEAPHRPANALSFRTSTKSKWSGCRNGPNKPCFIRSCRSGSPMETHLTTLSRSKLGAASRRAKITSAAICRGSSTTWTT
ncbi:hypothetical protein HMSSN139_30510 [Paenibacillus sp. HMSSN-139]|nr:hypothetical protein HMSSN139_30510 [Paenibacillus sp. HMSSN-139]